jgi:hypothetical protein
LNPITDPHRSRTPFQASSRITDRSGLERKTLSTPSRAPCRDPRITAGSRWRTTPKESRTHPHRDRKVAGHPPRGKTRKGWEGGKIFVSMYARRESSIDGLVPRVYPSTQPATRFMWSNFAKKPIQSHASKFQFPAAQLISDTRGLISHRGRRHAVTSR